MKYLILVLMLVSFSASAEPPKLSEGDIATFSWDASITPDVTYNLYMQPRELVRPGIAGLEYVWTVAGDVGLKAFFVVAEKNNIESLDSNTVDLIVAPGKSGNFAVQ